MSSFIIINANVNNVILFRLFDQYSFSQIIKYLNNKQKFKKNNDLLLEFNVTL